MIIQKQKPGRLAIILSKLRRKVTRSAGVHYKRSYSQCGEDLIAQYVFEAIGVAKPTYLDIGAHHPTFLNNTYIFYRGGARGVNVEADPALIGHFQRTRPRDVNLNYGIGPEEGSLELHVMSVPTLNTFSADQARRYCEEQGLRIVRKIAVPVQRFEQIVQRYFESAPEFVSLDAEGFDLPILRSIDFGKYRPLVMCVETLTYSKRGEGQKIEEISALMSTAGYMCYADTHINSIYVDEQRWRPG
jgi:FkbM family methyltransferase